MKTISVMQIVDTLAAGGLERVAVNLANHLPAERFRSHLCVSRHGGPLDRLVSEHVGRVNLERRWRLDHVAVRYLVEYIRQQEIQILHAHGTSLALAVAASLFRPHPRVVWHDHFGRYATEERPVWLYRLLARRLDAVIAVNEPLADWSCQRLGVPQDRVRYVPNFVTVPKGVTPAADLPGVPGKRIVCVANFRPEKDHFNLYAAMKLVIQRVPAARLILIGAAGDSAWGRQVQQGLRQPDLKGSVSWLGARDDVPSVLRSSDIGVLGSASEGLPLALIEYGMAGLPVVATAVGQCAEVLDHGGAGLVVPPRAPEPLANALVELLESPEQRARLGQTLRERIERQYCPEAALHQIGTMYELVLGVTRPARQTELSLETVEAEQRS
jgi:glycosyltransferase involved in cell wall biosynthesis